jgi:hypothetical protein
MPVLDYKALMLSLLRATSDGGERSSGHRREEFAGAWN